MKAKFKRSNVFRMTLQNIKRWGERLIKGRKRKLDEEPSDIVVKGTARAKEDVKDIRRVKPRRERESDATEETGSRESKANKEQRMTVKRKTARLRKVTDSASSSISERRVM